MSVTTKSFKVTVRQQHAFDQCRTFGHAWYEQDATRAPLFGYYMWLQCERCDTIRKDIVDLRGDLSSRHYQYPNGYKASEKLAKSEYRMRTLRFHKKLHVDAALN